MVIDVGRIKHLGDLMHKSIASNGTAVASNWKLSADGLKNVVWTPEGGGSVSYGSNSNEVSYVNAAGASTLVSRADHVHRGVTSLSHASNTYTGPVTLVTEGGLYIVRSADNTYKLGSTGGVAGGGGAIADAITGQVGAGGAIIPGLQGSADIRVAGTNDDEFDTTDTSDPMTGWTTIGTPTAHNINSTARSHYYLKKNSGSLSVVGIYKTPPSTPFTVSCKLTDFVCNEGSARAQLMIGEATPGKMVTLGRGGVSGGSGPTDTGYVDNWNSPTSYASTRTTTGKMSGNRYFRFVVVSSTDVTAYFSLDGLLWVLYGAANFNPGFTIASVGLIVDAPASGVAAEALFDWVRFT